MAKKKTQKKISGSYSGNRPRKETSFGEKKRKTYMILSTAAIIIGLLLTGWQSMAGKRSNVELSYSDITTVVREMEEPIGAFNDAAGKAGGVKEETVGAVTDAYEELVAAETPSGRAKAGTALMEALSAVYGEADEAGLETSAYKAAKQSVEDSMKQWSDGVEAYNTKAEDYNAAVTKFPMKIMAMIMQYTVVDLIEV